MKFNGEPLKKWFIPGLPIEDHAHLCIEAGEDRDKSCPQRSSWIQLQKSETWGGSLYPIT